ncbi:MAG: hypothetical protein HY681_00200 [Chloroflexi bacterium]|nr:hypothetical protein [Chloroflexota bacterium]
MTEHCYRHKDVETLLHCGNCGKPICVRCTVQHPVGIRCPDCARSRPVAALDVTPLHYGLAVAAAAGIGLAGVVGIFYLSVALLPLGLAGYYLRWLALVGVGYLMGVGVSRTVGGKRGRGLQWIAGVAMAAVFLASASLAGLALDSMVGILALGAAVYIAVQQLRV